MTPQNVIWKLGTAAIAGVALFVAMPAQADPEEKDPVQDATQALEDFKREDPGVAKLLDEAAGYVVFPGIKKAAVAIGGAGGSGVLFEKGKPIGKAKVSQVTVGLQLGGEVYSELILFQTPAAVEDFKKGKFEFASGVSAVAAKAGAAAHVNYDKGVAVMTRTKSGLMAEAAVGTQKFKFEPFKKPVPAM